MMQRRPEEGVVYLVGAGPSDAELITVKGKRLLEEADVIVYDRLVGNSILSYGNKEAKYIDVGKRSGYHPIVQEEINQILVDEAKKGGKVVRLKGGDPLVFGRGAEEAEYLNSQGIAFEIVPGITSAVSVPAYLGIPVTHRDKASSFHVVTAHKKDGSFPEIAYHALTEGGGTLVFLMGVHTIKSVAEGLMKSKMPPETPAAILERGTTARQRKIKGTIGNIARKAKEENVQSPAIILVGQAASEEQMEWYDKRPLAGRKFVVTRPREQKDKLTALLREKGAEVLEAPTIRIVPIQENPALDAALENLEDYGWIVFTSPTGVEIFRDYLKKNSIDNRKFRHLKFAVIGEGTAGKMKEWGFYPDLMPEIYDSVHLAKTLTEHVDKDEKILLPRARMGSRELTDILEEAGISVADLPLYDTCYESQSFIDLKKEFEEGISDYAVFTSASTVRGFVNAASDLDLSKVTALCIGEKTEEEARKSGMITYTARQADVKSLVLLAEEMENPWADRKKS